MSEALKKVLLNCINEKNFLKYNELLKKQIIFYFVKKIQEKNKYFLYSNIVELLDCVEMYLSDNDIFIFNHFYDLCKKDYEPEVLSGYLTDVYEKIVV